MVYPPFYSSALDEKKGYIEVIDDTGKTIASSAPKEEGGTHTEKKTIIIQQTLSMSGFPEWRVRVFLNESAFTTPLKKADQKTVIVLIFLLLLFTFVSGIIISAVTKPIRELEQIVRHIDPANPQVSREIFKIARQKGEIASLAESFFNMAIRIKKNYGELQQNLREKELLLQEVHHRVKTICRSSQVYSAFRLMKSTTSQIVIPSSSASGGSRPWHMFMKRPMRQEPTPRSR